MSLSLYNHDGTWFSVTSTDVPVDTIISNDVISLNITEEMAKMDSGSIQLLDRNLIYSRLLRPGAKLKVSWGVRKGLSTALSRSPIEVMINSPSGSGDENGRCIYNVSFMALGFRGDQGNRWYETGTKADVVADAMSRIGISTSNQEISFTRGSEAITSNTKVVQYESDFRFLVRCADEWRCAFRIGYNQKGKMIGCFVDYSKLKTSSFASSVGGSSSVQLEYGGSGFAPTGNANVLSYSWNDHSMDAAQGDGARIVIVDGVPQIYRTVVENETVKYYRLVPERIEAELKSVDTTSDRTTLMMNYLSAKTFDEVKRFFVEDTTTTAPQGSGIEVNAKMMGDPSITASLVASFGSGFPDRIGAKDRTWWIRKASHDITSSGYFSTVDIADAYSFSPTGEKL